MSERVLIVPIATNDWWAPVVRWFLCSKYNHIFVLFEDSTLGGWWAREALFNGVQIISSERSSLSRVKHAEFYEYKDSLVPGLQESRKSVGVGYDRCGLVINIFRMFLYKVFKIKWLRPVHDPEKHTCPEDIMQIFEAVFVPGIDDLRPSMVMPGELRDFMLFSEDFHTVENPTTFGGS